MTRYDHFERGNLCYGSFFVSSSNFHFQFSSFLVCLERIKESRVRGSQGTAGQEVDGIVYAGQGTLDELKLFRRRRN